MQFRDLKKQYQILKSEIDIAIQDVLNDGNYIMGKQVEKLELELAEYVGVKHCISCANGTDALQLALMAWEIGESDAVFVPDFTFFSSAEVVSLQKATPIFVDVDYDTCNIDPEKLEKKINEVIDEGKLTPKVIITVDLFGCPADYMRIKQIAKKYNLLILEDSAQGFGGSIDGQKACSFGDVSTTSFFPAKPLGCYGDGGAIFTNDDDIAYLLRSYRIHGKGSEKYDNVRIGLNSRLDTIQAAILSVKLLAFKEKELDLVNQIADKYSCRLKEYVDIPSIPSGYISSWAQYTIKLQNEEQRNMLKEYLSMRNIPSMIYYPKPMHKQTAFEKEVYRNEDFKISNTLCNTVLSLPMHPYLEENEVDNIVANIIGFISN